MKTLSKNRLMLAILAASLSFLSLSASAAQDSSQRWIIEQAIKAKQQAQVVEAAKATKLAECRRLQEPDKNVKLADCTVLLEQNKGASESK